MYLDEMPSGEPSARLTPSGKIKAKDLGQPSFAGQMFLPFKRNPKTYDRYLIMREPLDREEEPVALGMVSGRYTPLQNTEAFEFFEPFIRNHWATFETAGALGQGERVWVLAKLTGQIAVAPSDSVDRYLLLSNTHDGRGAVSMRSTPIRVVCQNTLNWAEESGTLVVKVRHSRKMSEHLKRDQATELKQIVDKVFTEADTLFGRMVARELQITEIDEMLESLFPRTDRQKNRKEEPERWALVRTALDDAKVTPPDTRNTHWGLYNAIVRAEDYRATEQDESARLERIWFGRGHDLKLKALNLARTALQHAA